MQTKNKNKGRLMTTPQRRSALKTPWDANPQLSRSFGISLFALLSLEFPVLPPGGSATPPTS